jgi:hypothetical protein
MRQLLSVKMFSLKSIYSGQNTTTFQCNSSAVSKLIRFKLDLNLSNGYVERRSPDGQCNLGVGPNVPEVQNQSLSENENTMDRRVDVPINMVTFIEFGLVIDTCGMILQDELEDRHRKSLDKIDRYF